MTASLNANLYARFDERFDQDVSKIAIQQPSGHSWTYKDLQTRSAQYANALTDAGLKPGDRVSVQVEKSVEALCLYLGCLRAGFIFHPLNTGYQRGELAFFIGNAESAVIVCDPRSAELFCSIAADLPANCVLTLDAAGLGSAADRADGSQPIFRTIVSSTDDGAALLYSSGTTGTPKGIRLSHGNLLSNAEALVTAWGFEATDVLLHALPIFHVHGLFVALGCVFLSGASMRWHAGFDARAVVADLPHSTVLMGVPTYYTRLLDHPGFTAAVGRAPRLYISGSAPLLTETFAAFRERTGHSILERYGMTETNMITSNPLIGERRPGTVGQPLPGVDVRVVDEAGKPLPPGIPGFVEVRGPNVFAGYWRLPEKTREDFCADGFFKTGDNGQWDEAGYLAIVGRAKDLVITGGLNVYPKEVETVIDASDGVVESAVIGVPHPDFGEAVVAVIVTAAAIDTEALRSALKRAVASFKVPKRILVVEELPRNTMGKVQKNLLRERYADLFVG